MIQKIHTSICRSLATQLVVVVSFALILSACGGKPAEAEVAPTQQPAATSAATAIPSAIPALPIPDNGYPIYSPDFLPLATKPDVSAQTINGVTAVIDSNIANHYHW